MKAPRRPYRLFVGFFAHRVAAPRQGGPVARVGARTVADDRESGPAPKPVRVLIVEDEMVAALHLESLLTRLGYHVVGLAADQATAVRAAERQRPDLVLMDIRLRASDGITAAEEIGARFGVRVLYLTAHSDPTTRQRAQASRPLGWIVKPAFEGEIAAVLQEAVAQLRAP